MRNQDCNKKQKNKNMILNRKGFTLIEILAVVVILGILLLIAVPAINQQLANFRLEYYRKLESSIKVTGEDYVADNRLTKRPTQLLYSRVIKVKDLEDEKYIEEVEDYLGNKCDNTDTSYSYVVVVKTGDKEYEYTTCLKCSEDEYATDTSGEENDFCNVAWMSNDNIFYTDPTFNSDILLIYAGTPIEEIRELLAFEYGIEKRDENGNVLATIESNGEKLYPDNINKLVSASLNEPVTLTYHLPDGNTMEKQAMLYKHYAPEVSITYTDGNSSKNIPMGQKYNEGSNEWANKLTVRFEFSSRDHEMVVNNVNIKTIEYYDSSTRTWKNTGCTVSKTRKSCVWTINSNFNETVKFRVVNDRGERGDESSFHSIKVDTTKPTCRFINDPEYKVWRQSKTVSVGCSDNGGSACLRDTFSVSYPTSTIYNKKTDEITIMDNAGNSASCPVDIYVDSTPPSTCRITATSEGKTVTNNAVLKKDVELGIIGIDDEKDASGIESNAIDVRLNGNSLGALTTTYDKDNGSYEIVPSCRDNAGNITIGESLKFTLDKEVSITYRGNTNTGGNMTVQTCKYNQDCKILNSDYTKTGYHFIGWQGSTKAYSPGETVRLKSDLLLDAQWEPNKYTIHFNGNGQTEGSTGDVVCTYDKNCTLTKNGYAKKGYRFIGWTFGGVPYGDMQVVRNLTTANNGSVTMNAVWEVNSYKLTYDSNTGNACNPGSKLVKYGEPWGTLCTPTKTGYTFLGWYTSIVGGTQVTASTLVDAQDITVYAHWEANKYTINFNGNNNTSGVTPSVTCTYDHDCVLPDNQFFRTGYQFSGWTFNGTDYKDRAIVRNLTSAANGTVTLTAKWTANKYTINFNGNNNTSGTTASVVCTYDQDCTLTKNGFVRTGYTFVGWSNGSILYTNQQKVRNLTTVNNGTVTLIAIWASNNYTLTYNSKGGSVCDPVSKTIVYDGVYGPLCVTTRTGYIFDGWFTAETGGSQIFPTTVVKVTNNQTIYAHWTPIKYKVAFDGNTNTSGSMAVQTCTYDQNCKLAPNKFEKIGYTWSHWSFNTAKYKDEAYVLNLTYKQDETVTLKANWTPNNYTLTFNSNTGNACNPNTLTITYDAPYNKNGKLCEPTKTGYHFLGWFTDPSGGTEITASTIVKVVADQTVYAHWAPNIYRLTYDTRGGSACNPSYRDVAYDAKYGTLCTTTRTGYTFEGWYTDPTGGTLVTSETIVRGDLTVYAHWRAHQYTIKFAGNKNTSGSTDSVLCTYDQNCTLTKNGFVREGYTFSGWLSGSSVYTNQQTVKNLTATDKATITMTAIWTANNYTLTYDAKGGSACDPKFKTVTYDSEYGPLCTTARTGYIFNGWFTAETGGSQILPTTIVKTVTNHTAYAHWTPITYKVAFDGNTNTSGSMAVQTCTYDQNCKLAPNKFEKIGYTFANWSFNSNKYSDGGNVWNLTYKQDETVTLKANWTPNNYTLTFNSNTGNACNPNTLTITYDAPYNKNGKLCEPTKTGYHFLGWFTDPSAGTEITASTIVKVTANQTVYAHWAPNIYRLTYDARGGSACNPSYRDVAYDAKYGTLCTTTRTGYTFEGWYTDPTGGTQVTAETIVRGNLTVYAHWRAHQYTIQFAGNKNTSGTTSSVLCTYDLDCTLTKNGFVRDGYTFNGWLSGSSVYTNQQTVKNLTATDKATITMTAIWTANNYTLTYDAKGGSACDPKYKTVTYDSAYGTLCTTTRTGYIFNGWFTAETGGIQILPTTIVKTVTNHTAYAHWTPITYKVAFDGNTNTSGTMATQTCTYDQDCALAPNKFAKTGYTFANWSFNSNKYNDASKVRNLTYKQDETVTLKANWTPNNYTLTFNSNTGNACNPATLTITYDAQYNKNGALCTPTKTGYHFLGWYTDPSAGTKIEATTIVKVTANQTVYAHWEPNAHRLTYNTQGGTACNPAYRDVLYDSKYGTLCTTTRTGYTFEGWFTAPTGGTQVTSETVVRGDLTIYARWRAHTYTINFAGNNNTSGSTASVTCTYDQDCTLTTNGFVKTGYTFTNWTYNSTSYSNGQKVKNLTATDKGSITMTAVWAANQYVINFNGNTNDSGTTASVTCTYDKDCKLTPNGFKKAGHSFGGWLYSSSVYTDGQTVRNLTSTPNASITMSAIWKTNTYTLTYNNNGGSGCVSQSDLYGKTWGTLCTPTRTGYTFQGWYTALTNGTKINGTDVIRDNLTAYARWTPITYNITFGANGGTGTTAGVTCTYDQDCTLTANGFSRTGYTWTGWSYGGKTYTNQQKVRNLTATNGATLAFSANWSANTYTINFGANGATSGATAAVTCTYDQDCTLTANGFARTGYTWASWSYGGKTYTNQQKVRNLTTSGSITMQANWNANSYTIAFNANGGTGTTASVSCKYDQDCKLTTNGFSKTGHTFKGWQNGSSSYTNGQTVRNLTSTNGATVTLSAVWDVNNYTLTYNSNGGSTCSPASKTVAYGSTWGTLCAPTRTGYIFNGWFNGSTQVTATSTVTGSLTVTASWTPITYYIAFSANGGTGTTAGVTCKYDQDCTLTANGFSRTGYTWNCWAYGGSTYTNQQKVKNLTTTNGATVTLSASWSVNKYTLTYNNNGGSGCTSQSGNYGSTWGTLCSPTRTGYIFNGWYNGTTQITANSTISGNLSVTASWTPIKYSITFSANGGSGTTAGVTCTYDQDCTLTANGFSRTGYTWTGWSYGGKTYTNQQKVKNLTATNGASLTFSANWSVNTYILTYNNNGGSGCTTQPGTYGTAWGKLCTPTRTGYTFNGWYNGSTKITETSTVTGSLTVTASWTTNSYTLTYNNNGGSGCTSKGGTYGSTWGALCSPTRTGYIFNGWYNGTTQITANSTVTGSLTVTASWTPITYYIAFSANGGGGTTASVTCKYDQDCTLTANGFSRTGYTWTGWTYGGSVYSNQQKVRNLTSANGTTVTMSANWSANAYTLTYNSNGGSTCNPASKTGTYGSTWGTLCTPSRTGYIFNGWYNGSTQITANSTVSGGLTVTASWTPITYYIDFSANGGSGTTGRATCKYDQDCTLTANGFSRTGYLWSSWSYGGATYSNQQKVKNLTSTNGAALTFSANWNAITYYIAFNANGGTGTTASVTCRYDQNCTLTANGFSRTGYSFNGWQNGSTTYTNKQTVKNLTSTNGGTVTLSAIWGALTYTLNYNSNGGNACNPTYKTGTYGSTWGALCTPTRTGYTFNGWYSGSTQITANSTITGNITVSASWTANTYTLTYNSSGGSACSPASKTGTYGSTWGALCTPTRTGYTFTGWYSGSTQITANSTVTGSLTVTAGWSTNAYTLTYNSNGGSTCSPASKTGNYGSTWGTLCAPTRTGYLFNGWYSGSTKITNTSTITGSLTVTASWSPITYYIDFNANGGTGTTGRATCTYDKDCTLTANGFSKTGHTWAGWTYGSSVYSNQQKVKNLTSIHTGVVVFYAAWSANTYSLTYNSNGGSGCSGSISKSYGSTWGTLCTPSRTGYIFNGWYSGSTKITNTSTVTGSVSVTASWTPITYYIDFNSNGGTGTTSSVTCTYDQNCTLRANNFSRSGYYWTGWTYGSSVYSASSTVKNLTSTNGGRVTMYAAWARSTYTLTYSYDSNAYGCSGSKTVSAGSTWGTLCNPSSYIPRWFDGWYTSSSGGTLVTASSVANSDITVYAHWRSATKYCYQVSCGGPNGKTDTCTNYYDSCSCSGDQMSCTMGSGSDRYNHWTVTCTCEWR